MTEGMTSKGTDRLTPGMLRDLAAIFLYREQQPHKPYLHAVFDREAARREAEGKPDPLACPFCGGSGHKDDIRISGSVMREGPGSADAPKLVPIPPYIGPKPAPAADDLVKRLLAMQHFDMCYPNPHFVCVEAANALRAQAREIASKTGRIGELESYSGQLAKEYDAIKARVARLTEALKLAANDVRREYDSQYAGRTEMYCTSCDNRLTDDDSHADGCCWPVIDAALAEANDAK